MVCWSGSGGGAGGCSRGGRISAVPFFFFPPSWNVRKPFLSNRLHHTTARNVTWLQKPILAWVRRSVFFFFRVLPLIGTKSATIIKTSQRSAVAGLKIELFDWSRCLIQSRASIYFARSALARGGLVSCLQPNALLSAKFSVTLQRATGLCLLPCENTTRVIWSPRAESCLLIAPPPPPPLFKSPVQQRGEHLRPLSWKPTPHTHSEYIRADTSRAVEPS